MKKNYTKNLVMSAMFAALAYVCVLVIPHIKVQFLTFDIKDAVITIAAMIYGPITGAAISLIVAFVEMITVSTTGPWGFLMNFLSSAVFSCTASIVYRYMPKIKRTLNGAILGLLLSVVLTTGLMMPLNMLITPLYTGASVGFIITLIPTLLLPFNFVKSLLNAALVLVLYKPITVALKKARVIDGGVEKYKFDKTSVLLTVMGGLVIVGCVAVFIVLMNGSFSLIEIK